MAKSTGNSDFSEVADTGLTPEAQAALDTAMGKASPAPVADVVPESPEAPVAPVAPAAPSVPEGASVPSVAKTETINGLTVTTY